MIAPPRTEPRRGTRALACLFALLLAALAGCGAPRSASRGPAADSLAGVLAPNEIAFLDSLERATFEWFWDTSDSTTGLTPDRWPTKSFSSVAAVGFALTAYPIGAERGWITREQALERATRTLEFFWNARQDTAAAGASGYRGFFYHFLDPATGVRFERVELSTQDTAILMAGVLFCQSWFDRDTPREAHVRAIAESLYARVEWDWAVVRPPVLTLGWFPEEGHLPYDYRGLNETMILYLLALGSPTHPAPDGAWEGYTSSYQLGEFHGQTLLGFAPLFGHHYSHVWVDFRGIQDAWMKDKGFDYFENTKRATLSQRAYAIANPEGFRDYGENVWGLSACDGPLDADLVIDGRKRHFRTYAARGACFTEVIDDGTIAPTGAGGSVPFAPKECVAALLEMRARYGAPLFGRYGFVDAFNPTLNVAADTHHGRVVPGLGWFDTDYLGIDQGPIVAMIENARTGLVWNTMRRNPHLVRGLRRAGFTGGWLDAAPATP